METFKEEKMYLWEFGGRKIFVKADEIIYFHTEQRKLFIHTTRGVYRIGGTLKAVAKEMEDLPMIKTHSSYLVRLEYIESISRFNAILKNGECIPVSQRCFRRIKPLAETYIEKYGGNTGKSVDMAERLC